jgi:hypothetical protein
MPVLRLDDSSLDPTMTEDRRIDDFYSDRAHADALDADNAKYLDALRRGRLDGLNQRTRPMFEYERWMASKAAKARRDAEDAWREPLSAERES